MGISRAKRRSTTAVALALLAAALLALSGCGSSGTGASGADPAKAAPAGSLGYVELTVRPHGSLHSDLVAIVHRFASVDPDALIQKALNKTLHKHGEDYAKDIRPWLGEKVGVVVTSARLPDGIVAIAPTGNASAARAALTRALGDSGVKPVASSYRGVAYELKPGNHPVAAGIVGSDAVVGGQAGFEAIVDAQHGPSLADQSAFKQAMSALPSESLARGYGNVKAISQAILTSNALPPAIRNYLRTALSAQRLSSTVAFGLSLSGNSVALDLEGFGGTPGGAKSSADVSGLPGGAWLALATGGLPKNFAQELNLGLSTSLSGRSSAILGLVEQRIGINFQRDLIPALGPIRFEVQGSSIFDAAGGLSVTPADMSAATRLLTSIRNLVARGHSLIVAGGPTSFTLTTAGAFKRTIAVAEVGNQVLATFNLPSFSALTSPTTTLATNSTFMRARGSLPSGATVPFFLDFGPLASILGQTPQFAAGGKGNRALKVIQRLDYVVIGAIPGHARIVFAMH